MPKRKATSGVRTGRFKFGNGVAGETIIFEKSDAGFYRFFNGGQTKFSVEIVGGSEFPIEMNCSVDVHVAQQKKVKIKKAQATDEVEGVYEAPESRQDILSGRFKFPVRAAVTTTDLIVGGIKRIYRLMNSGEKTITVKVGGGAARELKKDCSLDLFVDGDNVTIANAVNEAIQGVYDLLNSNLSADIRSGRFKSAPVAGGAAIADVPIIDFTEQGAPPLVVYRIYNTGSVKFKVLRGATELGVVQPKTSIEIETATASADRKVTVKADGGPFEGIYELISIK